MVDKQIQKRKLLMVLRALKLLLNEATMKRHGWTCKHNESWRVGSCRRINGQSWRPLDLYDKVMKERRMAGVQHGRAWGGLHAWQTHYVPDEVTGAEYRKTVSEGGTYSINIKDGEISNTKNNIHIPSSVELVSRMEPALAYLYYSYYLFMNAFWHIALIQIWSWTDFPAGILLN